MNKNHHHHHQRKHLWLLTRLLLPHLVFSKFYHSFFSEKTTTQRLVFCGLVAFSPENYQIMVTSRH